MSQSPSAPISLWLYGLVVVVAGVLLMVLAFVVELGVLFLLGAVFIAFGGWSVATMAFPEQFLQRKHPPVMRAPPRTVDPLAGFSPAERAFLEEHEVNALEPWCPGPLQRADPHQFLCVECGGDKRCPDAPHPYCNGWCEFCGGAGQFPIHPSLPWQTPPPSVCPYPRPSAYSPGRDRIEYVRRTLAEQRHA